MHAPCIIPTYIKRIRIIVKCSWELVHMHAFEHQITFQSDTYIFRTSVLHFISFRNQTWCSPSSWLLGTHQREQMRAHGFRGREGIVSAHLFCQPNLELPITLLLSPTPLNWSPSTTFNILYSFCSLLIIALNALCLIFSDSSYFHVRFYAPKPKIKTDPVFGFSLHSLCDSFIDCSRQELPSGDTVWPHKIMLARLMNGWMKIQKNGWEEFDQADICSTVVWTPLTIQGYTNI